MLSLQFVLSVLFWSALYPRLQGPPALGFIFHVAIVIFGLGEQMSTELLPTVTDTLLCPEGEKEGEGYLRRIPGKSLTALEFWSVLHREIPALLHARVRVRVRCGQRPCPYLSGINTT